MKITVRIENQQFEANVGELSSRPIKVTIEGQIFEVWPEEASSRPVQITKTSRTDIDHKPASPSPSNTTMLSDAVCAPIPGKILSIAVKEEENVTHGQVLCTLEAMKMNNTIRAPRAGKIARVHVSVGQHVAHGDVLVEYKL